MAGWIFLGLAIASEVAGTVALRYSNGLTDPLPTVAVVVGYGLSIWLLALTLKDLEVSLAYAVWAGIGTAAIAVIGIGLMGESVNALKLASIAVVIVGVVGLNLAEAH